MIPYVLDGTEIFFLVEKLGLEMATMGGFEEDDNEAEDPEDEPSSNGPWSSPIDRSPLQLPQEDLFSTPQSRSTSSRSQNQRFAAYDQPLLTFLQPTDSDSFYRTNYSTLATNVPQVFSTIPNPYSIAVPASALMTTPQSLIPSTKPEKIKYWRRSDYNVRKATRGDLTVLNDASGSDSDEEMPRKKKKAKTNVLGFLEHADGTPFDETTISFSLLDASLAPANWRDCSLEATNRFRAYMIQAVPALALGENYWKVDLVGTEVYAQWKRKHLPAGGNVKDDKDDDDSLQLFAKLKESKFDASNCRARFSSNSQPISSKVVITAFRITRIHKIQPWVMEKEPLARLVKTSQPEFWNI
ncbi:hypothetical protein GGX14DRAFT_611314 [Mycena pura]|uniref:Uncharacterized protein n=1 Tax=Mycena pura TaxID=153505 RepID=A0AAD6UJQ1_9AGAR|nr:hypothetical protein GGX14DRAFT_611314 [Mycena pura]